MHNRRVKLQLLWSKIATKYTLGIRQAPMPNLVPNAEKWVAHAYRSFYLRPSHIIKRLLSIRNYHDIKRHINAFIGIVGFEMNDTALSIQKQDDRRLRSTH